MKKIILAAGLLVTFGLTFNACVKKDFDTPPDTSSYDPNLTVTSTIAEIQQLSTGRVITDDLTISGIVVMDDKSGNYYKKIVIQDTTGGIEILIDQNNLYNDYPIGRKVYVKLKGLFLGSYGQNLQLGYTPDASGSLSNIPFVEVDQFIVKANYPNTIIPDTLTLAELANPNNAKKHLNTLVAIKNVEFGSAFINAPYAQIASLASATNLTVQDCNGGIITMRNSGYAKFQPIMTPAGNGTLLGIYTRYNNTPQIYIRDTSDVQFTELRCDGTLPGPPALITIDSVRKLYSGNTVTLKNIMVGGIVISDRVNGNIQSQNLILQNGDKGIMIRFTGGTPSFNLGDSVVINIADANLERFNNLLQINGVLLSKASLKGTGTVNPKVITVNDLNTNFDTYESTLVKIMNCTFTSSGSYTGNKNFKDATGTFVLYTGSGATFANESLPNAQVNITGIVGVFSSTRQLQLRKLSDVE